MFSESEFHKQSRATNVLIELAANKLEPGPTREFLKALRLCAPCSKFQRFGERNDGGFVMCADGLNKGLVGAYSYGSRGYDQWGMDVASRLRIPLPEYDCSSS